MSNKPFADPSDDSKLILEYDAYVKKTVKAGGIPLTPDAWIAASPYQKVNNIQPQSKAIETPVSKPVEYSEKEKEKIGNAFAALLIPQGFGSRAEIVRAELKQWYALKRQVDRVFHKLVDLELVKQRET